MSRLEAARTVCRAGRRLAARGLIAVDFDGPPGPIVPDPAQARALPAAVEALAALTPLIGTMAVLTGRPALTAVEYGSLDRVPGIVVLGHYGRQRWHDGALHSPPPPEGLAVARRRLPGVLSAVAAAEGTWVEDKADALAVHTRAFPPPRPPPSTGITMANGSGVWPGDAWVYYPGTAGVWLSFGTNAFATSATLRTGWNLCRFLPPPVAVP